MFNKKTKLKLTDFECNLLGGGMNEFRNMLLSDGTARLRVASNNLTQLAGRTYAFTHTRRT